ncbi:peptidoglycan DD-metalloendopeptidase family protein [Crocosphaera sp. Alani8]|uniref:peptidoglycan DD-metalloendopeptidase family protein n=1 Tax=Crocosphaera sp. Alani8 TaxID=3038952 RepID=UPI00313E1C66
MSSDVEEYARVGVESSSEDSQNKLASGEKSRPRCSAAMLGLAISMGATGILLSQDKAVIAANEATANSVTENLPSVSDFGSENSQLAPLALKHKVEEGETILQLANNYQVKAEEIALINNLAITATLEPGQTIKIPSSKDSVQKITPKSSPESGDKRKNVGKKSVNTSLDHLRETRKRLQDSLAELKTEGANTVVEEQTVADVSQPLNQPPEQEKETVVGVETVKVAQTIEIPTLSSETEPNEEVTIEEEMASLKGFLESENEQSTVPVVPSLQTETNIKIESDQPIPISVTPSNKQNPQDIEVIPTDGETSFLPPRKQVIPQPNIQRVTQKSYRVRRGDTLNSIARRHGISTQELISANGITNANLIRVNQTLMIPQKQTIAEAQPNQGTTLPSVFEEFGSGGNSSRNRSRRTDGNPIDFQVSTAQQSHTDKLKADIVDLQRDYGKRESEVSLNQTRPDGKTVVGEALNSEWSSDRQDTTSPQQAIEERLNSRQSDLISAASANPSVYNNPFELPVGTAVGPDLPGISNPDDYLPDAPMRFTGHIWPSKGVLTSGYGPRWGRMHKGIDIAAPVGTPIMASAPGEVISAGWNSGGFGNLVKLRHPDGSVTLYAHNSRILVRRGQKVEQGQQIAEMGSTGYSTGPHLHYEIHLKGRGAQNPMAFLPKNR